EQAERSLARLDDFARRAAGASRAAPDPATLTRFRACMDDDLDTPEATALVFDTVRAANAALDAGADAAPLVAAVGEMAGALGLELARVGEEGDAATAALGAPRGTARGARGLAAAARLRPR